MELNREALERNSEAFERHEKAFHDLRAFMHELSVRNERVTDRIVAELIDLRKETQAQTQAILRMVDRFDTGGPEPA
jgi:hypothetical protein